MTRRIAVIVLLICCFLVKGQDGAPADQPFGKVNFITGKAYLSFPKSLEKKELVAGMDIPMNATVETKDAARLEIKTNDNHFVRLWEKTIISCFSVNVSNIKDPDKAKIVISVKVGKIWNNMLKDATASRYEVSTPQGVCGVRGTIYNSGVDGEGNTEVMVFEGEVAVNPVTEEIKTSFQKTFGQSYRIEKPFQRIKKPYQQVTKEQWEMVVKSMQRIYISASGERTQNEFSLEEYAEDAFTKWNRELDSKVERTPEKE